MRSAANLCKQRINSEGILSIPLTGGVRFAGCGLRSSDVGMVQVCASGVACSIVARGQRNRTFQSQVWPHERFKEHEVAEKARTKTRRRCTEGWKVAMLRSSAAKKHRGISSICRTEVVPAVAGCFAEVVYWTHVRVAHPVRNNSRTGKVLPNAGSPWPSRQASIPRAVPPARTLLTGCICRK